MKIIIIADISKQMGIYKNVTFSLFLKQLWLGGLITVLPDHEQSSQIYEHFELFCEPHCFCELFVNILPTIMNFL